MPRHSYQLTARVEVGEISDLFGGTQDGTRPVTLKVFSPRASDADYGRALIDVARAVGGLQHPALLHYEDVGMREGRLCAVRAHVDGHHLGLALVRLATREVVLPGPVALQIMLEVLGGLGAAHGAGVIHGALTPANLLAGRDGRVFVSDFGALSAMQQSPVLRSLTLRGRRAYRAPELEKGVEPTATSDVFSAGAILYELLTLRSVGADKSGVSTRRGALVPPSRLDRRIHARLDSLVLRALDPSPTRRFANCQEMEDQLRSFLTAQGGTAGRAEVGRFVSELFPNEVTVSGPGGDLPFVGAFELEVLHTGASIPGLAIEVGDRESYSAPAPSESETNPEFPEARVSDATVLDTTGPLSQSLLPPVSRPGEPTDWYAPPGPAPAQIPPSEAERTDAQRPPTLETERSHPPYADEPRPDVRRPAAEFEGPTAPGAPPPGSRRGGRNPTSVPMPEGRRSSAVGLWSLAGVMAVAACGFVYLGIERRLNHKPKPAPHSWAGMLAPGQVPEAHPRPPPGESPNPHPDAPLHVAAGAGCLNVHADVRAQVTVDDGPPMPLPLETFPVTPGPHKLVVVDLRGRYQAREVEVGDEDTHCPGRTVKVALRHRDAKD